MRHPSAKAARTQVEKPALQSTRADWVVSCSSRKFACATGQRPEGRWCLTAVVFSILVCCSRQNYSPQRRVGNQISVEFWRLQIVPIAHPPTSAEHDRIRPFRQFRFLQIPRNTSERRSMRPVWMARPLSLCYLCMRRHVTGLVMGAAQSWQRFKLRESPVKHGVELTGGFQFHLPPVFRPPASASLNLPPAEGHEANGAADDTPQPRNTA